MYSQKSDNLEEFIKKNNITYNSDNIKINQQRLMNLLQIKEKFYGYVSFKKPKILKFHLKNNSVNCGQYVIVPGDRGFDIGLLIAKETELDGNICACEKISCFDSFNVDLSTVKIEDETIIRVATDDEIKTLNTEIKLLEEKSIEICRNKCKKYNLFVEILYCEIQFDATKISFYFDSPYYIDFRAMVKELHHDFKMRIWMENISVRRRRKLIKNDVNGGDGASSNFNSNDSSIDNITQPKSLPSEINDESFDNFLPVKSKFLSVKIRVKNGYFNNPYGITE